MATPPTSAPSPMGEAEQNHGHIEPELGDFDEASSETVQRLAIEWRRARETTNQRKMNAASHALVAAVDALLALRASGE